MRAHETQPQTSIVTEEDEILLGRLVDDYLDAVRRGEDRSVDALADQYPQFAKIIRNTFPSLLALETPDIPSKGERAETSTRCAEYETDSSPGEFRQIGDFVLRREIGRGGMGLVFEAEQQSLPRRVALKLLPAVALFDDHRLARFKQETQVAAMLQHPHIVRAYCVGCDDGLHYYAMELIDGQSCEKILDAMRDRAGTRRANSDSTIPASHDVTRCPTRANLGCPNPLVAAREKDHSTYYRKAANLFEQIARALHYAHEQGVVHRDIKPSNILVGQDGKPWVTDFGLARIQSESSLTCSGTLVGTLRYMSPEQAAGQKLLDHRTDIYALGATLYEFLTLTPAIPTDEHGETLKRIEAGRWTAPRSLVPTVPRSLELIVVKAMALRREDRYADAQEMADDLRRYLDHRPVRARRANAVVHAWHWMRRNRALAALAATVAMVGASLAVGGPLAAFRYSQLVESESQSKTLAESTSDDLRHLLTESIANTVLALENSPATGDVKKKLIDDALLHCRRLLDRSGHIPQVRFEVAGMMQKLAFVVALEFDESRGQTINAESLTILHELWSNDRFDSKVALELARGYRLAGNLAVQGHDHRIAYFQAAEDVLVPILEREPENLDCQQELGYVHVFRGRVTRNLRRQEMLFRQSVESCAQRSGCYPENAEYRADLLHARFHLANVLWETGRRQSAFQELQECYDMAQPMMSDVQTTTRWRLGYVDMLRHLGRYSYQLGRDDLGREYSAAAVYKSDELVKGFPQSHWARSARGWSYLAWGESLSLDNQCSEAIAAYRIILENWNDDRFSAHDTISGQLLAARHRLADLLWWEGSHSEATAHFEYLLNDADGPYINATRMRILADCPNLSLRRPTEAVTLAKRVLQSDDAASWMRLGIAQYRVGDFARARESLERVLVMYPEGDAETSYFLAMACQQLGDEVQAREHFDWATEHPSAHLSWWTYCSQRRRASLRAEAAELLGFAVDIDKPVAQPTAVKGGQSWPKS